MSLRETVLSQINHKETLCVPYAFLRKSENPELDERIDRYFGCDWTNILKPYLVTAGNIDTGVWKNTGDKFIKNIFGSVYRMDGGTPHLVKPILSDPSFENFKFPSHHSIANPDLRNEVIRSKEQYPDSFTMVEIMWGMHDMAWSIRGFENALMDAILNPDFYQELIDRLTDYFLEMVSQCIDLPVDAIMTGDDWGTQSGVLLGPKLWRQFIKPAWAKVYEAIHAQNKLVISHCCGSILEIMPDIIEIGLDVLQSVQPEAYGMNPYELKHKYGDKITFWGGLGSQHIIPFGTPKEIRTEVLKLRSHMSKGGGYILGPAKGFQPETPLENAVAVIEAFIEAEGCNENK